MKTNTTQGVGGVWGDRHDDEWVQREKTAQGDIYNAVQLEYGESLRTASTTV